MIGLQGQPEQPQITRAPEASQPAAITPSQEGLPSAAPEASALAPDQVGFKHNPHPHKELRHELRFHDDVPAGSPQPTPASPATAAPTRPAPALPPAIVAALEAADSAVLKALCDVLDASFRRHQEAMARQRREAPKEAAEAKALAQALLQRLTASAAVTESAIAAAASKLLATRQGTP